MKLNYLSIKKNVRIDEFELQFSDFELKYSELPFAKEEYICVSYAWEKLGTQHPYYDNIIISERTLPVLQTAYYSYNNLLSSNEKGIPIKAKFWVDSLCIPINNDHRELHYFFMGEIYAKSSVVIVVFSNELESVLYKVRNSSPLTEQDFELLNNDKWVSRQWTYQEIVNSGKIYINTEKSKEKPIFASDFFDKIAKDIEAFTKIKNLSTLDFQRKYASLISLEAVILDWRIMEYQKRSVYQIMVNMEYRTSDYSSSKIKAMFGCISNQLDVVSFQSNDDYSTFLELCIKKGDYSFIFNTSLNRSIDNLYWKPLAYDFKPIYPWLYCYGEGQKGRLENNSLVLEDIILKKQCKVKDESLNHLNNILNKEKEYVNNDNDLLKAIKQNLIELNFEGNYNPIEIDNGFYFNQVEFNILENYYVGICTGVQWSFGAPAMLIKKNEQDDSYDFLSSGVFFGKIT